MKKQRRKITRRKKVSYNPFKMWGSYVGFVIVGLFIKIKLCFLWCSTSSGFTLIKDLILSPPQPNALAGALIGLLIWFIVLGGIGFLIGWLINFLWRKLR